MTTDSRKINYKYNTASDFKVYSITGLQGTITPAGDLVINCYQERHELPKVETFEIQENGQLKFLEREPASSNTIVREVPFAMSINPMQARAFANWLNSKADEFEKRAAGAPENLNG